MKQLNRTNALVAKTYPERIIQFGEGNFMRAFADWIVYQMNQKTDFNGSVVAVQPIANGMVDMLNSQDGLYHVNLQGLHHGHTVDSLELVDVISRGLNPYTEFEAFLKLAENPEMRFVLSNTTEAGITFDNSCKLNDAPAASFPGKLTQLLFHRYKTFKGDVTKGWHIIPCELIFHNGTELKKTILQYIELWKLGDGFLNWFNSSCGVYSTLVDRIVPGYPKDTIDEIKAKIEFDDQLVVKGEIFHLWVIEAPASLADEFPANIAGNVLFVDNEKPYHDRKVTLLNGPHTALAPVAFLAGFDTVRESVEDAVLGEFLHRVMYQELMETINLPREELIQFADDVLERFKNPFVKHFLTSIMLNAFPKFKARDLPGLKIYLSKKGHLPKGIVLGLAGIIQYYKGGTRGNDTIQPNDDQEIMTLLTELWASGDTAKVASGVLGSEMIWGENLNEIEGLTDLIKSFLDNIEAEGMLKTVEQL